MEACLSSKTITTVPLIKPRPLSNPQRKPSFLKLKRSQFSSSPPTCCQLGSSSQSPDDDFKPIVDGADWRSFRARLVADESAAVPPEKPSVAAARDHQSADKWVHALHAPERGCLLVASEKLDGVHIFERTVILLLAMGPLGPTGVILNRPSLMSIKETRSTVLDLAGVFADKPLLFGGPLEDGLFLVGPKEGSDAGLGQSGVFEEVMKGVYYGPKESVGLAAEMVKRNVVGVGDFRFFDGYCGWEREQLKDEIRAGYWTVAACSPSVIGLDTAAGVGLWEEVLGLMGPRKVW